MTPIRGIFRRLVKKLRSRIGRSYLLPRISYSEMGEDLIIQRIFRIMQIQRPIYLDIGAYHPFKFSNTALLHWQGSRGINVEPNPILYREFPKYRKQDINLNCGVGDRPGTQEFYMMSTPALSTFSSSQAAELVNVHGHQLVAQQPMEVTTIPAILARYSSRGLPHFLSLDAEGLDALILRSIDYDQWSPLVICTETIQYARKVQGAKETEVIEFLHTKGYEVFADTRVNTIFVLARAWHQ